MREKLEHLYKSVAMLHCNEQGTAFFISSEFAITAYHAIKDYILNQTEIILEFYTGQEEGFEKRQADVVSYNKKLDVAILKLNTPIVHLSKYLMFSDQDLEPDDKWESLGYPMNWTDSEKGTKYCYIKGEIYQLNSFDQSITYDIQLSSRFIKEDWPYSFGGLSGSPLILNGYVVGIIINEENSAIHTPLYAVSTMRISQFLKDNNINIHNLSMDQEVALENRLTKRLDLQKIQCESLFNKLEYEQNFPELNLLINSYYIQYDEDASSKVSQLAEYLSEALTEYACALSTLENGVKDTSSLFQMFKEIQECTAKIEKEGKLGAILLWMLLEGILGAPKTFTRYSLNKTILLNEIHAGIGENDNLILYMGDGKLKDGLIDAIKESIIALENHLFDIQEDIYLLDDIAFDYMNPSDLKKRVSEFYFAEDKNWNKTSCELAVFTGYNSELLKIIEKNKWSKQQINKVLIENYKKECQGNDQEIYRMISENDAIKELKINWFILPFCDIEEFKKMVLDKVTYK